MLGFSADRLGRTALTFLGSERITMAARAGFSRLIGALQL
jgi:hypothetical protein